MGRRKKEPESVHRGSIAAAAERLFAEKGIEQTTMDDIARQAGYSKATLYVYFKNKEAIVAALVLESMTKLHACIHEALAGPGSVQAVYRRVCRAVAGYQHPRFTFHWRCAASVWTWTGRTAWRWSGRLTKWGKRSTGIWPAFCRRGCTAGRCGPTWMCCPPCFCSGPVYPASSPWRRRNRPI